MELCERWTKEQCDRWILIFKLYMLIHMLILYATWHLMMICVLYYLNRAMNHHSSYIISKALCASQAAALQQDIIHIGEAKRERLLMMSMVMSIGLRFAVCIRSADSSSAMRRKTFDPIDQYRRNMISKKQITALLQSIQNYRVHSITNKTIQRPTIEC